MLDIETVVAPTQVGTDIVSVVELKRHMRITHSRQDAELGAIIEEAAGILDGALGNLNRTLFPRTWRRYLRKFPDLKDDGGCVIEVGKGTIRLPYPPVTSVVSIVVEDGESPTTEVAASNVVVRLRDGVDVAEIEPIYGYTWPTVDEGPRAVSVTYRAGYTTYPPALKRMLKILAAHNYENPEATINEPRQMMINRRVEFAMEDLRAVLRVPVAYAGWDEDA